MTIDEAIKANQALEKDMRAKGMPILAEGIRLGIEALKQVKTNRAHSAAGFGLMLPGETKD